ncbi:MAG: dihydrofolate reductase, partial [Nanoarchaeota archaeon]
LKRFNEITSGHKVIMGRKTYESIPEIHRPLPRRENIILSRSLDQSELPSGAKVFGSIDSILDYVNDERAFVIGGESVYRDFLEYARRLDITKVHRTVDGDTFFPEIDDNLWKLVCKESHKEVGKDYVERYSFLNYVRR